MLRPSTSGAPPKRRIHRLWLRITTPAAPGCIVGRGERAAERQLDAKQRQQRRRHHPRRHALGLADAGERHLQSCETRRPSQNDRAAIAPVDVVLPRHRDRIGKLRRHFVEHDDAFGPCVRQRREQHAVDDGVDRGVGADAEREREDGDGRERRAGRQACAARYERPACRRSYWRASDGRRSHRWVGWQLG